MKNDYNNCSLTGNLTADPELRYTPTGKAVCGFTLASNRTFSDGNGGTRSGALFIDVTVWGSLAEIITAHKRKGDPVLVNGHIQMDSWDDKDTGQKRTKLKIVAREVLFLPSGGKREESDRSEPRSQKTTAAGGPVYDADGNEDIPF